MPTAAQATVSSRPY